MISFLICLYFVLPEKFGLEFFFFFFSIIEEMFMIASYFHLFRLSLLSPFVDESSHVRGDVITTLRPPSCARSTEIIQLVTMSHDTPDTQ